QIDTGYWSAIEILVWVAVLDIAWRLNSPSRRGNRPCLRWPTSHMRVSADKVFIVDEVSSAGSQRHVQVAQHLGFGWKLLNIDQGWVAAHVGSRQETTGWQYGQHTGHTGCQTPMRHGVVRTPQPIVEIAQ